MPDSMVQVIPSTPTARRRKLHLPNRKVAPPTPDPPEVPGFQVTKRTGRWSTKVLKGIGITAGVLLVIVIARGGFIPARSTAVTSASGVDPDAAKVAATQFASDYLSHDPTAPPAAGQDALRRDLAPGADPARLALTGTGYLATDLVIPGAVTTVDGTHSVVSVQARVTLAMPAEGIEQLAPTTAAPPPPGRPANAAILPPGYEVTSTQWLALLVPVTTTDGGVLVDLAGPVFSTDAPLLTAGDPPVSDSTATAATRDWVKTLFTSYAVGSTTGAYLSAPGVALQGLSGAVTVADIESWSLSEPDPANLRHGTARVGWSFAPTADLTTAQTYSVTVQTADTRWYVTALGPSTSTTN